MGFEYAPPKYAQVVAEIKRRIEEGDYPPGSLLPSEHQLVQDFGVSRPTIVKALSALRQENWIETQQGRGSFVRGRPALAQAERTRPAQNVLELPEAQLAGDLVQAGVKVAPPHVAALLGLETGAKAFLRQRVLSEDGEPVELASAWLPLELAAGTDLASPNLIDESIRHHLQIQETGPLRSCGRAHLGAAADRGRSRAAARLPRRAGAECHRHGLRRCRAAVAGDGPRAAR